jgi:hypothetical protein
MRFPFDSEYVDYRQVLDAFLSLHGKLVTIVRPAYRDASGTLVESVTTTARCLTQSPYEGTQRDFTPSGLSNLSNEDGRDSLWFRYDADVREGDSLTVDGIVSNVTMRKPVIHLDNQNVERVICLQVHKTRARTG